MAVKPNSRELKEGDALGSSIVIRRVGDSKHYECQCICGTLFTRTISSLLKNNSNKCSPKCPAHHSRRNSPTYKSWWDMYQRCYSEDHVQYQKNGGVGVRLAEEWHDFNNFLKDMGEKPSPGNKYVIGKRDAAGDFSPANCHWVRREGLEHNPNSRAVEWQGEIYSIPVLAKKFNIHDTTLRYRLNKGWDLERALTKHSRKSLD